MLFDLSERRINFNASSVVLDVSEPCPVNKVKMPNEQPISKSGAINNEILTMTKYIYRFGFTHEIENVW